MSHHVAPIDVHFVVVKSCGTLNGLSGLCTPLGYIRWSVLSGATRAFERKRGKIDSISGHSQKWHGVK